MIHFLHQIVQDLLKANQLLRASLNSLSNCHGCPQQTMVVQKSLVTSLRSLTHRQECGDGLWPPRLHTPPWNVWRNSRNTSSECSLRTLSESVNPERNRRKSSPERLCQMSTMMISVSNIRSKKMTRSRKCWWSCTWIFTSIFTWCYILIFLLSTDDASFRGNDVNIDKIKGDVLSKYIICEELGRSVITEISTCMTFQLLIYSGNNSSINVVYYLLKQRCFWSCASSHRESHQQELGCQDDPL